MDARTALGQLEARSDPLKAAEMAAYHKVSRRYLGVPVPEIDALTRAWRAARSLDERLTLAGALWDSDTHEARVAAARLLDQARLRPDDTPAWRLIASWVPTFDAWALADHASIAGQKRLIWDPARLDEVEPWTASPHLWTRRAALVMTLPWARLAHPTPAELAVRERVLGWAAGFVRDRDWFIQKAVAWWLRDLSKRDPARVRAFLAAHAGAMRPFAAKEAARHLPRG